MKKTFLTLTVALATVGLYAQGTVHFATLGWGVDAKVFINTGESGSCDVYAAGTGYLAQLFYGPWDAPDDALRPLNRPPATFHELGYILSSTGGGKVFLDGIPGFGEAKVRIFAWEIALGPDAAAAVAAWQAGRGLGGWSNTLIVRTGSDVTLPSPPAPLIGLQDWYIGPVGAPPCVPEPSALALAAIGLLLLAGHRRQQAV